MRSSADRRADTSSGCADGHVEAGPPSPARLVYGCAERAAPPRSNLQCRAPDYESRRFLLTRNTTKSAMKTAIVAKKMVISHLLPSMIVGPVFVRIRVRHRSPSVENRCSPKRRADRPAARAGLQRRRAVRLAIPTRSGTTRRGMVVAPWPSFPPPLASKRTVVSAVRHRPLRQLESGSHFPRKRHQKTCRLGHGSLPPQLVPSGPVVPNDAVPQSLYLWRFIA